MCGEYDLMALIGAGIVGALLGALAFLMICDVRGMCSCRPVHDLRDPQTSKKGLEG